MQQVFKPWVIIGLLLCMLGCQRSCIDCTVRVRETIDSLVDNQSIIVYEQDCTSNSPTITNIAFQREDLNIKREWGDIFRVTGLDSIRVLVLSKDSVKIVYKQKRGFVEDWDMVVKEDHLHGITFMYEDVSNPRFPAP